MIANYYESYVEPEILESEETTIEDVYRASVKDLEIIYSGSPAVRAGGGYKKFTLKERIDGKLTDVTQDVEWKIEFPDNEDKLEFSIAGNIFKVKCKPDYSLIGQTFTIIAESEQSSKSMIVEVISL